MSLMVILIIIGLVGVFFVMTYNALIKLIEAVHNNEKQIDIQLDRRYKVFTSLIDVVKKYMDYESSTLKDVVELRNQAQQAKGSGNDSGRMEAENKISGVLGGINMVFEQYPDLKANQNAMQLQKEIVSTENKLAFAKQSYNDSVERYNTKKKSLFESIIVSMFAARLDFDLAYWQLSEDKVKEQEEYTVKL